MPAKIREWTPLRYPSGRVVHATSFRKPGRTVCGLKCTGGVVVPDGLDCQDCKALVHLPVKKRRRR